MFNFKNLKGKHTKLFIHRFLMYVRYGNKIFNYDTIRHLDGNKLNNSDSNLKLGSQKENMLDKPKDKRKKWTSHPTYNHVAIIKARDGGMTYKEIMEKYNIKSKSTVSRIINKSLAQE